MARPSRQTPGSARRLARARAAARRFAEVEASGGIALLVAALAAVAWANSGWASSYQEVWGHRLDLSVGSWSTHTSPGHLVNDALMAIFFLVVGLELRTEWSVGELRDRRAALLPAVAALGGMIVPAVLFSIAIAGGDGGHAWGVPMATDIAFAVGVLSLLASRVTDSLKVFLLTLAIVDDLGAIVVIALFYAGHLQVGWILVAVVGVVGVVVMQRVGVERIAPYVAVGSVVWFATWQSGLHATLAGAVLGMLAPDGPREMLTERLHPWSSFLIVPVFALANAGVPLSEGMGGHARVAVAVAAALVIGKAVGVVGACAAVVRLGWARLPDGVRWRQMVGVGCLAGIGFTMSLFIAELAFTGGDAVAMRNAAKVGIFGGSVVAAAAGAAVLLGAQPAKRRSSR